MRIFPVTRTIVPKTRTLSPVTRTIEPCGIRTIIAAAPIEQLTIDQEFWLAYLDLWASNLAPHTKAVTDSLVDDYISYLRSAGVVAAAGRALTASERAIERRRLTLDLIKRREAQNLAQALAQIGLEASEASWRYQGRRSLSELVNLEDAQFRFKVRLGEVYRMGRAVQTGEAVGGSIPIIADALGISKDEARRRLSEGLVKVSDTEVRAGYRAVLERGITKSSPEFDAAQKKIFDFIDANPGTKVPSTLAENLFTSFGESVIKDPTLAIRYGTTVSESIIKKVQDKAFGAYRLSQDKILDNVDKFVQEGMTPLDARRRAYGQIPLESSIPDLPASEIRRRNDLLRSIEKGERPPELDYSPVLKGLDDTLASVASAESKQLIMTEGASGILASGDFLLKKWNTTMDGHERLSHAEANGQVRWAQEPAFKGSTVLPELWRVPTSGEGTLFNVGGDALEYPRDFGHGAGPAEIINCRCQVTYFTRPSPNSTEDGSVETPEEALDRVIRVTTQRIEDNNGPLDSTEKSRVSDAVKDSRKPLQVGEPAQIPDPLKPERKKKTQ